MLKTDMTDRVKRIVRVAEKHFRRPVEKVTAPGGEGRSSFRVHFSDMEVIATLRPNDRRTQLEAFALTRLHAIADEVPECLGVMGDIMFQSDVGRRRLSQDIAYRDAQGQVDLAAQAVSAIFRFQSAARRTDLHQSLPMLGRTPRWIRGVVNGLDVLERYSDGTTGKVDRNAAAEKLNCPGDQFIKWDCRSGNAALGPDGKLRWFDFEYCGLRHGAEDIAWLIGDEVWPIAPEDMVDVVIDAFDPECGHRMGAYLEYLSIYLTFHALQRLKLVLNEASLRGWLTKRRVLKYDDVGVHPEFAAQICRVGRYFSAQTRVTAPLTRGFDRAMVGFQDIVKQAALVRSA